MNKKFDLFICIMIFILLFPILFFPVSSDLSIFLLGGRTIVDGAKIYVDFIDLKPFLIYYFFAFIYKFFNHSEFSVRLFDYFYQLLTIFSIIYTTKKITLNKQIAYIAGIIYALSYSVLTYSQTMQCESFAGLFLIWALYLHIKKSDKILFLIIEGLLIGIITALKYTMGLALFFPLIYDLIISQKRIKTIIQKNIFIFLGFLIVIIISFLPILDKTTYNHFVLITDYLKYYSSIPEINKAFFIYSIKAVSTFWGDNYSLLFVGFIIFAIKQILQTKNDDQKSQFFYSIFFFIVILFCSVAFEKKFGLYHFSRMYAFLSILCAYGCYHIYISLKDNWIYYNIKQYIILCVLCMFSLLFSPVPRWISLLPLPYYYFTNIEKYDSLFDKDNSCENQRTKIKKVANIINSNTRNNDKVIVVATGAGVLNYLLKTNNISKFTQSQFYFGAYKNDFWFSNFKSEIYESQWIVLLANDWHPLINGHPYSSYESFNQNKELHDYLINNFTLFSQVETFYVYKRNK